MNSKNNNIIKDDEEYISPVHLNFTTTKNLEETNLAFYYLCGVVIFLIRCCCTVCMTFVTCNTILAFFRTLPRSNRNFMDYSLVIMFISVICILLCYLFRNDKQTKVHCFITSKRIYFSANVLKTPYKSLNISDLHEIKITHYRILKKNAHQIYPKEFKKQSVLIDFITQEQTMVIEVDTTSITQEKFKEWFPNTTLTERFHDGQNSTAYAYALSRHPNN